MLYSVLPPMFGTDKREYLRMSYKFFVGLRMKHKKVHEARQRKFSVAQGKSNTHLFVFSGNLELKISDRLLEGSPKTHNSFMFLKQEKNPIKQLCLSDKLFVCLAVIGNAERLCPILCHQHDLYHSDSIMPFQVHNKIPDLTSQKKLTLEQLELRWWVKTLEKILGPIWI